LRTSRWSAFHSSGTSDAHSRLNERSPITACIAGLTVSGTPTLRGGQLPDAFFRADRSDASVPTWQKSAAQDVRSSSLPPFRNCSLTSNRERFRDGRRTIELRCVSGQRTRRARLCPFPVRGAIMAVAHFSWCPAAQRLVRAFRGIELEGCLQRRFSAALAINSRARTWSASGQDPYIAVRWTGRHAAR